MSKQPIPEFNPKKSFKEVSSVPEFDPSKSFTEKKNPVQNGSGIGTQTSLPGSKPFLPQVDTKTPSVLTEQGRVGYEQEIAKPRPKEKPILDFSALKKLPKPKDAYYQDPTIAASEEKIKLKKRKEEYERGEIDRNTFSQDLDYVAAGATDMLGRMISTIPSVLVDNAIQSFGGQMGGLAQTGIDAEMLGKYTESKIGLPEEYNPLSPNNALAEEFRKKAELNQSLARKGYNGSITDALSLGKYKDAAKLMTLGFTESLPLMLGLAATRGAGLSSTGSLIGMGLGTQATTYQDLKKQNPEIAKNVLFLNATLTGLGEAGSEVTGTNMLYNQAKKLFIKGEKEQAKQIVKKGIKEYLDYAFEKSFVGSSVLGDVSGEVSNQIWKNAADKWTGVRPDIDYLDGVGDAALISAFTTSTIAAGAKSFSSVVNPKIKKQVDDESVKISNLQKESDNPNITPEVRTILLNEINNSTEKINKVLKEDNIQYNELDDDQKTEVDNLVDKKDQIESVLNDTTVSDETKELIKPKLIEIDSQIESIKPQPKIKDVLITPETSSNYANMTEDDKGNFVFFHVGNKGYETVKPGTGGSTVTSREEASALSKVGGLAMYYTDPNQVERQSASGAKYAVKIPKEKVYDFNTDKLNFIEEAKARHEAENPGKAFDVNSQLAYVTKIAGENGFDMVVAQWNNMTRAQTTKELTPADIQEYEGDVVKSKFTEQYESNKKKGFEPVVPVSKSEKLATLYDKINKIRNKEKRYDDLYRLYSESGKLDQENITELINESDLPQEIKDEYKNILESKEEARRSQQTKPKEDAVQVKTTGEVPVQPEAKVGEEVVKGKPEPEAKITTEKGKQEEVARLRSKEQAELNDAILNADKYKTDGKIDRAKITDVKDLKKFDEIYNKYDKLITPLLPTKKDLDKESIEIGNISSKTGIKAKNLRDLYNINRKIFSQDRIKSIVSAIVMDRMIGAMAKRSGVSKDKIYNKIYFKKATLGEIKSIENNSNVLFQANYSDDKTGITFSYDKNTDKFNKLKKEGYITDNKNINDFSGQYIIFHKPDYAFSGDILKNGNIIVEGQGGIYYPIKFHEEGLVWAASSERAAKAFAKRLNESAQLSPDGKVRLALVSSPNEKVLSSYNAAAGIVDVLSSKVFDEKFGLNEEVIKSALIESSNSELGTNITNDKSLKEIVSIIKQKLDPENIGSIDKRRSFIYFGKNSLLFKIAENIKDTKNIEDLVSFFGDGIANKDFVGKRTGKLSRANLVQAFSYMFNEPMLRDVKDSDLTYAVIEVPASKDGGDVVTYEKNESHKSYPYSIVIKDKSEKTILNILSETSKWNESAIDPLTNKTVAKERMLNLLDTMSGVSNKPLMISKPKQVDINWEVSKEGKGDPSISSRNPIVEEAAKNLKEGNITNEEYRATVSENSPIGPITRFFAPATDQQIKRAFEVSTKKDTEAELINEPLINGEKVGLRLDIPSYKFNNTWVVSVHDGDSKSGKIKSYRNVAKIRNVKFGTVPKAGLSIASGDVAKTTIARMFGDWVEYDGKNSLEKAKNAKDEIENIANDKNWVQVGMNPFRHSYFYDRSSDIGRPILGALEVVQIGGLVYAKNPEYGNWSDEAFAVRDSFDSAGNEIRFQDKMGAIITQDSNSIIYALTDPNVSTPLHEMAHAFEHYLTLNERKDILNWANTNTWTKETSEKFARGFEKYLSEGKAPTPLLQKIFNKFKEWLTEIYNGIIDSEIDIELNEKMRSIYSSMLGEDKAVAKLNESNVENAIELLDDIEDNKRKAERASSRTKANLEQKIAEAKSELDKIPDEAQIVKVINDNFDKIKKDLKEQGLLNIKC